jgi:hypothetical protein
MSKKLPMYREFFAIPEYVSRVAKDGESPESDGVPWWSGSMPLPKIGEKVNVIMNGLGIGVVEKYFVEYGWLGVMVKLDSPPEWYVKQNGANHLAHIYGVEMKPL